MKRRTILIVPPRGTRVKAFQIRLYVVVLLFSVVAIGLTGYLIPFNSLDLNVQEQNQKKNLAEQNKRLLQNIISTLHILNSLKEQVSRLEDKSVQVRELAGIPETRLKSKQKKSIDPAQMSPAALLLYVTEREKYISSFAAAVDSQKNLFTRVPLCMPVPSNATIMSKPFGPSKDPFTGKQKMHLGVDFAGGLGTPVVATASGVVSLVENDPIWGRRVVIKHANNLKTIYAHLGTVRTIQGRSINKGEIIGTIGLSGLTTGPHVHYELVIGEKPVNPEEYFFPTEYLSLNLTESSQKN